MTAIVSAQGLTRRYGEGEVAVEALADVGVARRAAKVDILAAIATQ